MDHIDYMYILYIIVINYIIIYNVYYILYNITYYVINIIYYKLYIIYIIYKHIYVYAYTNLWTTAINLNLYLSLPNCFLGYNTIILNSFPSSNDIVEGMGCNSEVGQWSSISLTYMRT